MKGKGNLRTCDKGHHYYKSSDCPTCPTCESAKKPKSGFLSTLAAPAYRALINNGITSLDQLEKKSKAEILSWHGMGPSALKKIEQALTQQGIKLK